MKQRPKDSPFGALAALRGKVREGSPLKPSPSKAAASPSDADDFAAFQNAVAGVAPLSAANRAQIERPRPSPVPRPQPMESEPAMPKPRRAIDPNDASAIFRDAMEGVAPIADPGRIEIGRTPRRATIPARHAPPDACESQHDDVVLTPLAEDDHDPVALFRRVVGTTAPLPDRNRAELERPSPAPEPRMRKLDEAAVLRESIEAPLSFEDRIDIGDEGVYLRDGLPRRVVTDLRRGRWVVQAELDLHGLTRDEARSALAHFLHDALEIGHRCVRLIHGKGLGSPGREPVLKHLSRGWLMQREELLAFCQARPHDGGEGALLILLRNASKKLSELR